MLAERNLFTRLTPLQAIVRDIMSMIVQSNLDLAAVGVLNDSDYEKAQSLAIEGSTDAYPLYLKSATAGNPVAAYMVSQYLDKGLATGDEMAPVFWALYSYLGYSSDAMAWLDSHFVSTDDQSGRKFVEYCLELADKKNGAAAFVAGMAYYVGQGVDFDPIRAYELFNRSEEYGNLDGACQKALCMIRGSGRSHEPAEGLELLISTANKGNIRAALKYAKMLETGSGVPKNPAKALTIYQQLAEKKVPVATYETGRCYLDGIGTTKDGALAFSWFTVSQALGCVEGDFGLARCMLAGIIEESSKKGLEQMISAAEKGCTDAMYMLAQLYGKDGKVVKKNIPLSIEYYRKAADLGKPVAELRMSQMFETGEGVQKNRPLSVTYALRAACHGNIEGCFIAGSALLSGNGITKDEARGFALCKIASEQGFMKASFAVANCYLRGKGVAKDTKLGFEMHKELAERGFIKSMLVVAEGYYHGDYVPQDFNIAFKMFKEGAEKENVFCQYYLGDCYDNGNGTKKDPNEALKWYSKAARQGHIVSQKILEERKVDAILTDESPFTTFEKSARSGNAQSMYILGRYYEDGIGIEKDLRKAKEWYTKAKKRGNEAARRALEALEKKE